MRTQVMFKRFKGSIIALFPNEIADNKGNIMSYECLGQHGGAHPALKKCRNAKPSEYANLRRELESIGYELEVL